MASRNYQYYQPNKKDLKDEYGDCVIRALTKVTAKTWADVFDDLVPIAKAHQCMPNGKPCWEAYMSDQNFVGNSSGVAIRYKLLAFEQNIKNKERYMEKGLMERFKLYNHFLFTLSKMEEVPVEEIDTVFKRNLPSNDFEISQMINNLADFVDKETLISQLSFIKDASEIVELKAKEDEAKPKAAYDDAFNNNEMGDANANMEEDQDDTEMAVGATVS